MPATKRPFGLQPVRIRGGAPNSNALTTYRVGASAGPSDIGDGDPVKLHATGVGAGGILQPATAASDFIIGVAKGFRWVDPVTKRPTWSNYLPAGTSSADSNIYAYVVDDDRATFIIQADASVTVGDIGFNFELSAVASVNASYGKSQAVLKASTRTCATKMVRVLGLYETPDNSWNDAFPIVEVRIVQHRDTQASAY
jgi:hypothetical protein